MNLRPLLGFFSLTLIVLLRKGLIHDFYLNNLMNLLIKA